MSTVVSFLYAISNSIPYQYLVALNEDSFWYIPVTLLVFNKDIQNNLSLVLLIMRSSQGFWDHEEMPLFQALFSGERVNNIAAQGT